jgi:hypothetical protein
MPWLTWFVSPEIQVRSRVRPCDICAGLIGTVACLSSSSSGCPCKYYSTVALHTHTHTRTRTRTRTHTHTHTYGGWRLGPLVAAVQRHNLTLFTRTPTWTMTVFKAVFQDTDISVFWNIRIIDLIAYASALMCINATLKVKHRVTWNDCCVTVVTRN